MRWLPFTKRSLPPPPPAASAPSLALGAIILGCACLLFAIIALIRGRRTERVRRPRGWRPFKPTKVERTAGDCTTDAFKERKLPEEIDYVVIGSGIGSLYCAGLLARAGYRVVVLEQHYVTGGCTHSFEDKGYEFDTGLHYVGRIEKYKLLLDLVSAPGHEVEWAKMGSEADGYAYDQIKIRGQPPFWFRAGEAAFINGLATRFPSERRAIEQYAALVQKVNKSADLYFYAKLFPRPLQWLITTFLCGEYFAYASRTALDVVSSLTANEQLRALLCSQFGNYGLPPNQSSFLIQAGIAAHYMGGGYYPIGGPQTISRAIIPTIEAAGGRVFVRAAVGAILIEGGRAVGVSMRDGGEVRVRRGGGVISGAGAVVTERLVPLAHRPLLGYAPMIRLVPPSISHVYAFIGLEGTTESLGLHAANTWVLPASRAGAQDGAHDGAHDGCHFEGVGVSDGGLSARRAHGSVGVDVEPAEVPEAAVDPWASLGDDDDDLLMFMSFPSARDPSAAARRPNRSTACVITTAYAESFARFYDRQAGNSKGANQSLKRRDAEYERLKQRLQAKLLKGLCAHYPKCEGRVKHVDVATPLTNMYYLGRADSYGLEHTPAHYDGALTQLRPRTDIRGLYVTGQDVGTVGIVGALNGGILTAHACLGYTAWDLIVAKRNLIEDLMAMDADCARKMPKVA